MMVNSYIIVVNIMINITIQVIEIMNIYELLIIMICIIMIRHYEKPRD